MSIPKLDTQIQRDVLDELKWDTRVRASDVGVEVDKGIVTLTGTVDSYVKKVAAQEAAHRVAGVLDVANDLRIVLPGHGVRTDTDIAQAVRLALTWNAVLPEERIQSTVVDGWVTLEGEVDYWNEREDAEDAIRHLSGVKGVTNHLHIMGPQVEPQVVRKSIEDALERRAQRETQRIKIHVDEGRVTLSGQVQNWAEETAVLGAAAHAPGVRSIKNELRIGPVMASGGW